MKTHKITISLLVMLAFTLSASVAAAGDFDWVKDFNMKAEADGDGFKAQLSARFKIGDAQVKVVVGNCDSPADAYIVLRFGEMSGKSMDYVLSKYKANKHQGWGVLAKSLGIKPGSSEFHSLKKGHDINTQTAKAKGNNKNKKKGN
ncbi:hypothetical protein EP232_03990 [bacterium]|nr:MAG: hypothetical protein EP232_03990 [bacterium]